MRHTPITLAALLLALPASRAVAQDPAILDYTNLAGNYPVDVFLDAGPGSGFVFRPTVAVNATGLSFFNPAQTGGGTSLGGSYVVRLFQLTLETGSVWRATEQANAVIDGASSVRTIGGTLVPGGLTPAGAFWTTALAAPVRLTVGGTYGVAAFGPTGGLVPMIMRDENEFIAPTADPRVGWYSVGYATPPGPPGLSTWSMSWDSNSYNYTGASFELVTAAPEPSAGALVLVGALAGAWRAWRRRTAA